MKRTLKIFALGALVAGSPAFALPVSAQETWTPESCTSEWTKVDANEDGKLNATEAQPYSQVKTNIDTDENDVITQDEYTVACTGGVFDDMKKQG